MRSSQLDIQPENFEFEFESPFGEFEESTGEFEGDFGEFGAPDTGEFGAPDAGEFEAPNAQKNWYYFDAWWRAPDGQSRFLTKYGPRQETESDASRLFDTICLNQQNNSANQGAGKMLARCYQWFPVSSRWVACKNVVGFRRGMCASDESELGELGALEAEYETVSAAPVFRFIPAGCAPLSAAQSRAELGRAIRAGIALAKNAANKLLTSPRDKETRRLFRFFFGHDPSRPVPWANNQQSGESVGKRFLKVAEALQSRGTLYRCDPTCTDANAFVRFDQHRNAINLCPSFWTPPPGLRGLPAVQFRGAVVLHEMLHLLYNEFFHHPGHPSGDPVRRRDNSHCYEAFALRIAKFGADHVDVTNCVTNRPA